MILVANLVPSPSFFQRIFSAHHSFRDKRKAFFSKLLGGQAFAQLQSKHSAKFSKVISKTFRRNHQCVLEIFINFSGKHLCQSLSLINSERLQLYLKETPAQMFSCEICDIFKTPILRNICERLLLNFKDKFTLNLIFMTSTV